MEGKKEVTPERVTSMIQRIENIRDEVLSLVASCPAPGIGTLMERASDHIEKARAFLEENRLQNAEAEARIALNMYNRIKEICSI